MSAKSTRRIERSDRWIIGSDGLISGVAISGLVEETYFASKAQGDLADSAVQAQTDAVTGGQSLSVIPVNLGYANTWIGFGDSIMANNGGPNIAGGINLYDKGFMTWANASISSRLTCARNAGIASDNTAMLLARIETDVTPYASQARFVIFNGGVNDPVGGSGSAQTFTQSKANLLAIIYRLRQLFPVVIWCTPTPYAPSATVAAQIAQIAGFVRATAPTLSGVILCDSYAKTVNRTATTGDMVTGYSSDAPQLHPNAVGARAIGSELAAIFTPLVPHSASLPASQSNTTANLTATYATQVLPNPLLVTNGGTITGTNVTSAGAGGLAGAPSGFTVRAGAGGYSDGTTSVTCELEARTDSSGNDVKLVISAGANPGSPLIEILTADASANVSSGQTIQGQFTLSMSGASNVKKIVMYVTITDGSGSKTFTALTNDGAAFTQADISDFVFKTTPYTVSGACSALRLRAELTGIDKTAAATLKLGRLAIDILNP